MLEENITIKYYTVGNQRDNNNKFTTHQNYQYNI